MAYDVVAISLAASGVVGHGAGMTLVGRHPGAETVVVVRFAIRKKEPEIIADVDVGEADGSVIRLYGFKLLMVCPC